MSIKPFKIFFLFLIILIVISGIVFFFNKQSIKREEAFNKNNFFEQEPQIKVATFKFGILNPNKNDFTETKIIPLDEGIYFGWIAYLSDFTEKVDWQEILVFPHKPKILQVGKDSQINNDGKKVITKRTVNPKNNIISNFWALDENDPQGKYTIKVYIDNDLIKELDFQVTSDLD